MKSLLKKATPFVLVFSSLALAAGVISKEEVNKKVAAITAPFNTADSQMKIVFTALKVDTVRALDFGVSALVTKKTADSQVAFKVKNASYTYGDGTAPTVKADLSLSLDLVKAFGQESLNQLGTGLEEIAKDVIAQYGEKYGDALALDVKMIEMKKDGEGNIESAQLRLQGVLDYSKFPAGADLTQVEFKSFQALLSANKNGVAAKAQVVLNPQYKGFSKDQQGLKEVIEKLMTEDQQSYEELTQLAATLDGIMTYLADQKAE